MNIKPRIVSKFDICHNPAYQVNFSNEAIGKHIASTKRRLKWKFGFSSTKAIRSGKNGPDCRGEEHEVVMIWSITSSKCRITVDEKDVFTEISKNFEMKTEASWTMEGTGHVIKIFAHAMMPFSADPTKFRQYDLQIDGLSFFDMPQIYELGTEKMYKEKQPTSPPSSKSRNRFRVMTRSEGFYNDDATDETKTPIANELRSLAIEHERMMQNDGATTNRPRLPKKLSPQIKDTGRMVKKPPVIIDFLDITDAATTLTLMQNSQPSSIDAPYGTPIFSPTRPAPKSNIREFSEIIDSFATPNLPQASNSTAHHAGYLGAPYQPTAQRFVPYGFCIPPPRATANSQLVLANNKPFAASSLVQVPKERYPSMYQVAYSPSSNEYSEANPRNADNPMKSNTMVLYEHQSYRGSTPTFYSNRKTFRPVAV